MSNPPQENLLNITWFQRNFRPHFMNWIFGPIDRLVNSQDALIGFIFMACVIDYLSGFWWGESTKGNVQNVYTGFIDRYFPPGKYDSDGIYDSLRNGLVHMFTIKNKKYALIHDHPEMHLYVDQENQIVLNASDFAEDLRTATGNYFDEVEANPDLLAKLILRYSREGFLYSGISDITSNS